MNALRMIRQYAISLLVFIAIDAVWLGAIAPRFYKEHLGHLLSPQVNWYAAAAFYLIFILGLVVFVIRPAVSARSSLKALGLGALFGLVTYATYDLTNLATLRGFPLIVVVVDLGWGTILSATVAAVSIWLLLRWEKG